MLVYTNPGRVDDLVQAKGARTGLADSKGGTSGPDPGPQHPPE